MGEDHGLLHRLVFRPGDQVDGCQARGEAAVLCLHSAQCRARSARRAEGILPAVSRQTRRQRGDREVLRHDREHRHQFRRAAGEAQRVGHRGQHAGHLSRHRQRRHRGPKHLQCRHEGRQRHAYQGGTRAPCFFRWPAGGIPARSGVRRAERAPRSLPDARRDHRREAVRRSEATSRRPQPAAAAQKSAGRVGRSHARASRRTLGAGQGGGCEIRQVRDSEFALHAGQQRGALRPQGRSRRNEERHRRASRGGREAARRLRPMVERRAAAARERKRHRPENQSAEGTLLEAIRRRPGRSHAAEDGPDEEPHRREQGFSDSTEQTKETPRGEGKSSE